MIEFAYPWCFVLLIAPLFVRWFAPAYKEQRDAIQVPYFGRLVNVSGEKPQNASVIANRKKVQHILLIFSWLCLVIAMAKPENVGAPIIQKKSARDLMVAVDLSGSMAIEDFTNNEANAVDRLTAVKQVLADFVQGRKHDRLGLILFGDAPYLQAPFTEDLSTWLTLLNESRIGMAGQSTALGDSIGLAISIFNQSKTKHKVLIILTDGNDTGSKVPPIEAAKVAANYQVKIYTIAIGNLASQGEEQVNMAVLKNIATITGGASFHALDRVELLNAYQQINDLEPHQFDVQSFRPRTSVHHYPIILLTLIYTVILLIVTIGFKRQESVREGNNV